MIYPTVGRIVLFRNSAALDEQPNAAIIAYVHAERLVNLAVFDSSGCAHPRTYVPLIEEGDEIPDGLFAQWPLDEAVEAVDDPRAEIFVPPSFAQRLADAHAEAVANLPPILRPQAAIITQDLPQAAIVTQYPSGTIPVEVGGSGTSGGGSTNSPLQPIAWGYGSTGAETEIVHDMPPGTASDAEKE